MDLNRFLPAGGNYSVAYGIDANGYVLGIAADASNQYHAVEWQSVPEPASEALLLVAAAALLCRPRRFR